MEQERFAFIIRVWREPPVDLLDPSPQIRGSIQAVQSEQRRYFDSFASLPDLLAQLTHWQHGLDQNRSSYAQGDE